MTRPDWGVMAREQPQVGDAVDRAATLAAVRASMLQGKPTARPTLSRHILLRQLGAGGSGIVYEAYDPELGRKVAVKLLKTSASQDASTREARLRREAQATAKVSHPNVIAIYDVGTYGEEDLSDVVAAHGASSSSSSVPREGVFVVMELVDGVDLRRWMETNHPWPTRLEILAQAGRGLAAAHAQGLVHRDFKPDNVFVGRDGAGDKKFRVRVLDFGLARASQASASGSGTESDAAPSDGLTDSGEEWPSQSRPEPLPAPKSPERLTQTGVAVGTPAYMSPEQHLGNHADERSDQYNFCATAFEVLAGYRPFARGALPKVFEAKRLGQLRRIPRKTKVPKRVWAAIRRGLSPRPQDRWPSMDALLAELTPRRSRRLAGVAGFTVALALPVSAAIYGSMQADECTQPARALDEVWTDSARDQLEARVRPGLGEIAEPTWTEAQRRLDDYVEDWSQRRGEACRARLDANTEAAILETERRVTCLERHRLELSATLDVLRNEEGRVEHNLLQVLDGLQPNEACEAPDERAPLLPPPGADRTEALEIIAEVQRAEALADIGAHARRMLVATEAVARARALGHEPTLARAVFALAIARWNDQDFDAALAGTEEALLLAERGGDDAVAVSAMLSHADILGTSLHRFAEAERLLDWVDARSRHPYIKVRSLRVRGVMARNRGKTPEAVAAYDEAIDVLVAELPHDRFLLGSTLAKRAGALAYLGRLDEAVAAYDRALELLRDAIGSGPEIAFIYNNMGYALRQSGDIDRACESYEQARQMFVSYYGELHETVGMTLTNLGGCQAMRRQPEAALATQREGLRVKEAVLGPDHADVAFSWVNMGDVLVVLGRYEEAKAAHERANELWGAVDPQHRYMAYPHAGLAEVALGVGDLDAARTHVRRALELHPADQDRDLLVRIEFTRARIRYTEHPEEGRRRVAAIRDDVALRNDPTLGDAVDQWWAEHGT